MRLHPPVLMKLYLITSDFSFPGLVFAAGLADIGRLDGRVPGPHEGALSNHRKSHDAEYQPVVHPGAGTR